MHHRPSYFLENKCLNTSTKGMVCVLKHMVNNEIKQTREQNITRTLYALSSLQKFYKNCMSNNLQKQKISK